MRNVDREIFDDHVVWRNLLGEWTIPTRPGPMGVGYVTKWVSPDGHVLTEAGPCTSDSASAYLNDPSRGVGIGAFGMYVAFGDPPWTYWDRAWQPPWPDKPSSWTSGSRMVGYPGISWVSPPSIGTTVYRQSLVLLRGGAVVDVSWTFGARSARFRGAVRFGTSDRPFYAKEPEFCFSMNGGHINKIATPGTKCPDYTGLTDPRKRTGRCSDPNRLHIALSGGVDLDLTVHDKSLRTLAKIAHAWRPAGEKGCMTHLGYREKPFDNWEYVAWGDGNTYSSFSLLFKGWEGCVSGLDAPAFFRAPRPCKSYGVSMTIAPTD